MFKRIYKTVPKGMNVVANDMVVYWKKTPNHWIPISVHDAQDYANKGYFVVGGWINPNPKEHGHVVVAVPGKGIVSARWGGKIPYVLEMGRGIREPKYGLNYSFGSDKIADVVFFYYKQ